MQGGGFEWEEVYPISGSGSRAHACMSAVTLTHAEHIQKKKKKAETTITEACPHTPGPAVPTLKGLKGCSVFDLAEGRFAEGQGGCRDQWKSWALTCRTCEKHRLVIEKLLKGALEAAVGVKYPTFHFITCRCTFVNTRNPLLFTHLAQMEACYKFLQTCKFSPF